MVRGSVSEGSAVFAAMAFGSAVAAGAGAAHSALERRAARNFACRSPRCAWLRSVEVGLDLLAHQAQRVEDAGLRDLSAAIQLGENAVEPDLLLDLAQPRREAAGIV